MNASSSRPSAQKNILLLFPDQHRGDWLPMPSDGLPPTIAMPNLEKLQRGGATFTRAATPSPLCAPARACLAAGTGYFDCGVPDNSTNFPVSTPTFYQALRDAGYEVMSSGKLDLHKATKHWGENGWVDDLGRIGFTRAIDNEGKIDAVIGDIVAEKGNPSGRILGLVDLERQSGRGPYINYLKERGVAEYHVADMAYRNANPRHTGLTRLDDRHYCDNWLTANALTLLEATPRRQPWFLQVNFTGPHFPWDITESMQALSAGKEYPEVVEGCPEFRDSDMRIRSRYAAMLENIDKNIGLLLEAIDKRGESGDTVVIYCSDHGEMLGDFGLYGKCVHRRAATWVPLVIGGAGGRPGLRTDALVEMQDLAATILELAGIESSLPDSRSLVPLLGGGGAHREIQFSALDNWVSASDGRFKVVLTEGGKVELFDLRRDFWERNNIVGKEQAGLERLRDVLREAYGGEKRP